MDNIEFGDYLKHVRENLGISIQELCRRSEVTAGYINRIERKQKSGGTGLPMLPSPQILEKLAPHLKVSYHDLMRAAGHLKDVPEKPDLYQLLLAGLVKVEGQVITDINFAQKIVDIIKAILALGEDWQDIKQKQAE